MKSSICKLFGIDFPLVGFSYSPEVVVGVSKAGGCGVLGAALMTPEELDRELDWIDRHIEGRPYGIDLIIPNSFAGKGDDDEDSSPAAIPHQVQEFVDDILREHDIDPAAVPDVRMASGDSMSDDRAADMVAVSLKHPICLLANALGMPPKVMFEGAKEAGVALGALVGTRKHAVKQAEAGVDFIVAQGSEAGGHTGEIGTMVIVPEVIRAVQEIGRIPVLAAGGIATGAQMAAAMTLGAGGAWTGSMWLTTKEAEVAEITRTKLLEASSSDTLRSRYRTGKPSRQLRSTWHAAWEKDDSPGPLPMPLMGHVSEPPLRYADTLASDGHEGARRLATYWVGQTVGLLEETMSVDEVMDAMKKECDEAVERLTEVFESDTASGQPLDERTA